MFLKLKIKKIFSNSSKNLMFLKLKFKKKFFSNSSKNLIFFNFKNKKNFFQIRPKI